MIETPQTLQIPEQVVARLHITVPRERIRDVMGPGIQEVMAAIAAQGLTPTGAWMTHHTKPPDTEFDFDICVPIARDIMPVGRVKTGCRPAMKVVRTVYVGPYEGLGSAWGEFKAWIKAHGHVCAADLWECYARGPESGGDEASYRTELLQPLVG